MDVKIEKKNMVLEKQMATTIETTTGNNEVKIVPQTTAMAAAETTVTTTSGATTKKDRITSDYLRSQSVLNEESDDELFNTLERQIAEIHQAPIAKRVIRSDETSDNEICGENKVLLEMQPPSRSIAVVAAAATAATEDDVLLHSGIIIVGNEQKNNKSKENTLELIDSVGGGDGGAAAIKNTNVAAIEHEDLIAVLKGTDADLEKDNNQKLHATDIDDIRHHADDDNDDEITEGVTIEGEGQFQIMEIIDDPEEEEDVDEKHDLNGENVDLAGSETELKAGLAKKFIAGSVSGSGGSSSSSSDNNPTTKKMSPEEVRAVAMEQMAFIQSKSRRKPAAKHGGKSTKSEIEASIQEKPTITSVVILKTMPSNLEQTNSQQKYSSGGTTAVNEANEEDEQQAATTNSSSFAVQGKKRVIKRKIIWDPDAYENPYACAKTLSTPTAKKRISNVVVKSESRQSPKIANTTKTTTTTTTITTIPQQAVGKIPNRAAANKKVPAAKILSPQKTNSSAEIPTPVVRSNANSMMADDNKRRSVTPMSNGSGGKKRKITEIDRLMGDEGAANMLNSLENERSKIGGGPTIRGRNATAAASTPTTSSTPAAITTSTTSIVKRGPGAAKRAATPNEKKKTTATTQALTKRSNNTTTIANDVLSTTTTAATPTIGPKKRGPKPKASASWDYVYKQQKHFDDSMIVRRRSNSSYSSNASQHRLSLDGAPITTNTAAVAGIKTESDDYDEETETNTTNFKTTDNTTTTTPTTTKTGSKSFVFVKPPSKATGATTTTSSATLSTTTTTTTKPTSIANQRNRTNATATKVNCEPTLTNDMKKATNKRPGRPSNATAQQNQQQQQQHNTSSNIENSDSSSSSSSDLENDLSPRKTQAAQRQHKLQVSNINSVGVIKLEHGTDSYGNFYNANLLDALWKTLKELADNQTINAVVVGSESAHFCQSFDYKDLNYGTQTERKNHAVHLAASMKNYFKLLYTYPKPLFAAVSGNVRGLGVTQLLLFDVIVAGPKCTFDVSAYIQHGNLPEGYCLWNLVGKKARPDLVKRLFWLGEKINSAELADVGFLTKVTSKLVTDEAQRLAKSVINEKNSDVYAFMKKSERTNRDEVFKALDVEFKGILDHWLKRITANQKINV